MPHQELTTDRLRLRLIQPADVEFILQGLSDRRVTKYYAVHFDTLEQVEQEQMSFYKDLLESGTGAWWCFSLKEDDRPIGACGLNNLEAEHRKAEIGFWMLPPYWGHGYTSEAAAAVLKYGFEQLGLNRIEAEVEGGNEASGQVLRKLGFTLEGRLCEREFKAGRFVDLLYFGLLRKDWQQV
ncbi:GNAT family N-acetyltransferase [Pontibacter anaerobius]|uniref:GNAT family protein n=1 Tax=Pontibacter anaerobius TaxID=2993940 RepID=A0ABT3RF73_9BACT|nr:GNAT family protein [Pontibacter anaerobius]MCX2740420.1 GNAT family protein [Pontibacter anaerobius]